MTRTAANGWQTAIGVVGVSAGVFPLVMALFGNGPNLWWRWLFADPAPAAWWLAPLALTVVALVAVIALDRAADTPA